MKRIPASSVRANRRGLTSMIVIGFTIVLFIVFARLIYMMKQEAFMASHFHKRGILANMADGGASVGLNVLDRLFGDPKSEPFKNLTQENDYKDKVIQIYPGGDFNLKCLDELVAKYPGTALDVQARVYHLMKFDNVLPEGELKQIEKEKIGVLEVMSTATLKPYKQVVRERRWIKITCQALPVTSRFSLFLQEANRTSKPQKLQPMNLTYSKEWNRLGVSEGDDGKADGEPLVVASGMTGVFGDYKRRGWVFLGGGEKPQQAILLGLSGGKSRVGEAHHLFPDLFMNSGYRGQTFYGKDWKSIVWKDFPGDDFAHPVVDFDESGTKRASPDQTVGFFDSGHCKEIMDLSMMETLGLYINEYCNAKESKPPLSSALHLFGAAKDVNEVDTTPSPPGPSYVVMGNIFRAYAQIGVYQFYTRPERRWNITGFWPYLPDADSFYDFFNKVIYQARKAKERAASSDPDFVLDPPLDDAFYKAGLGEYFPETGGGDFSETEPLRGIDKERAFQHYSLLMSYMNFEPYANSSALRAKLFEAKIAPKSAATPDWGKDEDCKWGSVLPSKDKSNGLMEREDRDYTKSLNDFALPERYFQLRETVRYKGDKAVDEFLAFFKDHIKGGTLDYGKFILIDSDKPLVIPAIDKIEKGGVIVTKGDITLSKVGPSVDLSSSDDQKCGALLTIVTLGGKITLTGKNVNASLVALNKEGEPGTIEWGDKLELLGNMACRVLDPEKVVRKGGVLTYNPVLSPEHPNGYLTNNFAYCINLMPKIEEWEIKAE